MKGKLGPDNYTKPEFNAKEKGGESGQFWRAGKRKNINILRTL